jgi:phosphatidate cytidylyltransferase
MYLKRLVVALILLPVIYIYIMYLPPKYFLLLLVSASLIAMLEFFSMYHVTGILKYACFLFGIAIINVSFISKDHLLDVIIISVLVAMVLRLLVKRDPQSSLRDIAQPVIGLIYIPVFLAFQAYIMRFGPEWIIFLYASVWASDSMAYFVGKGMGKRKLYVEVSPNKTIAGTAGSIIGGTICALIIKATIIPSLSTFHAIFIGLIMGFTSVIGDLVESMFKRDAGVKDSSLLIPGHGGILDKIDGILFAGPVLYWILFFSRIMENPQ